MSTKQSRHVHKTYPKQPHVIFVGSGLADPEVPYLPGSGGDKGKKVLELTNDLRRMVGSLPAELQTNVAVWLV